ncbi:MAG: sulfotransferase family protein [Gemmatimonadales bacterium]
MKRLFIIGPPRSGSTWTMFLIAQHPEVVVCQHNRLFEGLTGFRDWFRRMQRAGESGSRFGISVVLPTANGDGAEEPVAEFRELLSEDEFHAICRQAVSAVYDRIASHKPGARVVVDKTPENARQGEFILKLFPDAYFLHIVRDPRAVSSSVVAAAKTFEKRFPTEISKAGRMWRADTMKAREIGGMTSNYLEVRYEALKAGGPEELRRIFSWLGLPADLSLCERAVAASGIERMRELNLQTQGFFRKGEADSWREELSPSDVRAIEFIAGDLMDELGYPRLYPASRGKPMSLAYADARLAARSALLNAARRLKRVLG